MKKKLFLLTVSILLITAAFAKGANPIPSYNVLVSNTAYFQEDNLTPTGYAPSYEKRDMNVSNDTPGYRPIGSGTITVYAYRLDQSVICGPFTIPAGETLAIPIDGHRWGVFVLTNEPTNISVWIDNKTQPPQP